MDDDKTPALVVLVGLGVLVAGFAAVMLTRSSPESDTRWSNETRQLSTEQIVVERVVPAGDGVSGSEERVVKATQVVSTGWQTLTVSLSGWLVMPSGGQWDAWRFCGTLNDRVVLEKQQRRSGRDITVVSTEYTLYVPTSVGTEFDLEDDNVYAIVEATPMTLTVRRKKK